jgi:tetratricopeptide (TPR) repeat protein
MAAHGPSPIAEAVGFLERGDLANAERAARTILATESDADALHVMGLVRRKQNLPADALDFFNRSLALKPGNPQVLANLGRTLKSVGRNGEAVLAFQAALAAQPDLADTLCELGELQYRAGDLERAEASLRRVLALAPSHLQAKFWLGQLLRDDGRPNEAEAVLGEGLNQAREPTTKAAFAYYLASAEYHQGKKNDALDHFVLAARLDFQLAPGADINRAGILEDMQRFDEAAALLEQTLTNEPHNVPAHAAYNNLLHRLGRDEEFLASYDRAPKTAALLTAKAGFLLKKARYVEAHDAYTEVLKSEPGHVEAAVGAATALNELNRSAEAAALVQQMLKRNPASVSLHKALACAILQLRDPKKAVTIAENAFRLAPTDQTCLALLGTAWRMMGDTRDEVLNSYDELIQIFDLEPPNGFSSMEDFNIELDAWLSDLHADVHEPLEQSLRGGSQTHGYIFGQGHALVDKLKVRIDEAITRYLSNMRPDARHPFRGRKARGFRFRDSWSSRLRDCGFHINHVHPGGWISSCYYVALPAAVKDENKKQGWIKFGEPNFEVGLSMRRAVQPAIGRLVLFPSYMWHGTIPFHEKATRTTIAFDAVPT